MRPTRVSVVNVYWAALVAAVTPLYARANVSLFEQDALTVTVHGPPADPVTEETLADLQLRLDAATYPAPPGFDDCGADHDAPPGTAGTTTVTGSARCRDGRKLERERVAG